MKNLKFRGLSIYDNKMIFGLGGAASEDYTRAFVLSQEFGRREVHAHTLAQFTGILDGTGAEIYEGDILCWPSHEGTKHQQRFVVEWCDDRNGWLNWHSTREQAVVIGNIHENPELLTT